MPMLDSQSSDNTLPGVAHISARVRSITELNCTILFHPDVKRIGHHATLDEGGEWVLGRQWPLFAAFSGDDALPLGDPHISRRALSGAPRDGGVNLQRFEGASRCRLLGQDLQDAVFLDRERLERGVVVLLSHCVVLLLRRSQVVPACPAAGPMEALSGDSPPMHALRQHVIRAAASDQDVLILGETGVGKELVARAVCAGSGRSSRPLVAVNMAAVPAALAAAFLFGNTRGAYSGAERARPGYFRQAHEGTLFLDEVGDTPQEIQPLMLRALQQREIQVVGGEVETVDVRVISATDARIDEAGCGFKSALRHRLGAIEINVPPLRDRPEDIGYLLLQNLRRACKQEGRPALVPGAGTDALAQARWADLFYHFAGHSWPGNVRELENAALQVVTASDGAPEIPKAILKAARQTVTDKAVDAAREVSKRSMSNISQSEFDAAMKAHRFEVRPVANALGVTRQSVYRRIDKSPQYRRVGEVTQQELQEALSVYSGDLGRSAEQLRVSESALRARLRAAGFDGCS